MYGCLDRHSFCITTWLIFSAALFPAASVLGQPQSTQVYFSNSCSQEVQPTFSDAMTNLHSFEYPETGRIFTEIIREDPDCAMAYWGMAMSLWHPLWAPPSKADLQEGAGQLSMTDDLYKTSREAEYIDALKAFYASDDITTHRDRTLAYESRMSAVYESHLDDPEAAVFYSLALLASADPHDKTYANQFKSAGLLNWVQKSQPTHPGGLHYLIHSYDYPGLAHLALKEANLYADTAPNSAHAQHMPSHIFTRLGFWDQSILSNHDSTKSAVDYTKRAHLHGHYDEGLHSIDYLMYALLQTARDDEAQELLIQLADIKRTNTENFKVAYTYAAAPARYALERREWQQASEIKLIRKDLPWEDFGWALSIHHFARGLGAARSGQNLVARQELEIIKQLQVALPPTTLPYWREEVQVQIDALQSWILLAEGNEERALELASGAADREDAVDKHPVTPGEVLPARELYADMLFETAHYQPALEQYRVVLKQAPNRLNALIGAGAAATQLKEKEIAANYYASVRSQTRLGNRTRPGVNLAWDLSLE